YIHAEDVASAVVSLLNAPRLNYSTYNVAAGKPASIGDLVAWAAEKVPGFRAELVAPAEADILADPALRDGMWGAYDVSRLLADTGWRPRPVRTAFHAYIDSLRAERAAHSKDR
ncbi:MAG: NAD(P)-dependent oxidoreductase, partial [Gammaproteobacteria bacterium]|nr:NAD(P)-dependent oxidoreductase [Gammaproteobacteria bacterium]